MSDRSDNDLREATSLPAWTYSNPDFYDLEREKLLLPTWQMLCHESDIPDPGAYVTLPFMGELLFAVRGKDGKVRAFHNICRHRAARLLDEPQGNCGGRITCPYHAWTYDLEGQLIGVPQREDYVPLDGGMYNLKPLEMGICEGFVFVRPRPGPMSFEDFIAPVAAEFKLYHTAEMKPISSLRLRARDVNWKVATDNYLDALHIPVAHPELSGLVGDTYRLEPGNEAYRITADVVEAGPQSRSVQAYRETLPAVDHLPGTRQRKWVYYLLWPNLAFDLYPDQMDFMQFIPMGPGKTMLREAAYALPDTRREMKIARYLNWRINRQVNLEDRDLIERVQAGLDTSGFETGPFGASETCLRDFAARIRKELPIAANTSAPSPEEIRSDLGTRKLIR